MHLVVKKMHLVVKLTNKQRLFTQLTNNAFVELMSYGTVCVCGSLAAELLAQYILRNSR